MLTKDTPQKGLLASKFLLSLREKWFNSYKFPAGIQISNIKYKHLRSKYNSSFYPFNDQLDYVLTHYFIESETTKGNKNKFLTNPLITLLTEKLCYKNANEWMEKLSEISQNILEDKWTEYKFNIENDISRIAR